MLSSGESISQISRTVGIRRRFIYKWAARFQEEGIDGLNDRPGRGRSTAAPATSSPERGLVDDSNPPNGDRS